MKVWPVPKSFSKSIFEKSFWENRTDRFHCGVDIYAKAGSSVLNIDSGKVIKTGIFTSSSMIPYWNKTFYVDVKMNKEFFCRFAEMKSINVTDRDILKPGDMIGFVGCVLNKDKIDKNSPLYIQKLSESGNVSMLHFELYKNKPIDINDNNYLGGNWFGKNRPDDLIDPTDFLKTCKK